MDGKSPPHCTGAAELDETRSWLAVGHQSRPRLDIPDFGLVMQASVLANAPGYGSLKQTGVCESVPRDSSSVPAKLFVDDGCNEYMGITLNISEATKGKSVLKRTEAHHLSTDSGDSFRMVSSDVLKCPKPAS